MTVPELAETIGLAVGAVGFGAAVIALVAGLPARLALPR
jgi:hypothetical protein